MSSNFNQAESKSTSLGQLLGEFPAHQEEIERIASLLREKTKNLAKYVFYKYAPHTPIYKQAEQKEKILGFRKGTDAYREKLLQRLAEHIGNPKAQNQDNCWALYQMCAFDFVTKELKALNKLLADTTCATGTTDTSEILKLICSNAFEFDAKAADVRKLYEVWWLTRVNNFDEILTLCSQVDPLKIHEKQLSGIKRKLDSLVPSVEVLIADIEAERSQRTEAAKTATKLETRITAIEKAIIEGQNSLSTKAEESIARIGKVESKLAESQSKLAKIEQDVSREQTRKVIDQAIKAHAIEIDKALAATSASQTEEIGVLQNTFSGRLEELQQQLAVLNSQIEDLQDRNIQNLSGATYKSPLSRSGMTAAQSYKITNEIDFVASWATRLSKTYNPLVTVEEAFAFHSLFLTNNIVVADYRLIDSWINCLGWSSFTRHAVASPLWSREEDWADGAHHIFNIQAGKRTPRLLVIHNFDVGIIDCYLIPTLLLWRLNRSETDHLTKLLLVPSGEQNPFIAQILEHAATIDFTDSTYRLELSIAPGNRRDNLLGVDPKLFGQWAEARTTLTYDLDDCIQKPFGMTLNHHVVSKFQKTISVANRFFNDSSAIAIGMHHHILPWIKLQESSTYGAICSRVTQLLDI